MKSFNPLLTSILAITVSAQLSGLPSCAQGCVSDFTSGTSIGGCKALDIACICGSPNFISGISCCLYANCSEADQQTSITYAHEICSTSGVQVPDAVVCPSASSTFGIVAGPTNAASSSILSASATSSAESTVDASKTGTATSHVLFSATANTTSVSATASASASAKTNAAASAVTGDRVVGFCMIGYWLAFAFL